MVLDKYMFLQSEGSCLLQCMLIKIDCFTISILFLPQARQGIAMKTMMRCIPSTIVLHACNVFLTREEGKEFLRVANTKVRYFPSHVFSA
jgi:hypothetical protein